MALKDNMCTAGIATTCSSRMLEGFVPTYDADVACRLYDAGAVLVGKANLDEFAMGSSTENSAFHPTMNPWDLERVPGGSSGGPAAAVAAGECLFALGSDTGGSIRQPAALCGVVGLKPTYGLVSRYGLIAFASSLDQIGPLTRDVTGSALVLNAIAGHDRRDSTSIDFEPPDYTEGLDAGIEGLRVGVPREYFVQGIDPGVERSVRDAVQVLSDLGAEVEETSLRHSSYAMAVYYIIAPSEASANLARYDGVKYGYSAGEADNMWDALEKTRQEGFGPEVKRRIMLGTYALSAGYYDAYYLKAQKVRTLIRREFDEAFERFDVLASPTSPSVAFRLGEKDGRPCADVPERHLHAAGEHRRNSRHIGAGGDGRRAARRPAAHGAPPGGADAAARRLRLRERDRLAHAVSGPRLIRIRARSRTPPAGRIMVTADHGEASSPM